MKLNKESIHYRQRLCAIKCRPQMPFICSFYQLRTMNFTAITARFEMNPEAR